MSKAKVAVIATLETKSQEAQFLVDRLQEHDVQTELIDTSLKAGGKVLGGEDKKKAMQAAIERTINDLSNRLNGQAGAAIDAVIGIGGGTGGEIALKALRALPITFPKILVTTLPFDPRIAIADNSIILVPTLVDICGMNATLREVFENAAAMTAGICTSRRKAGACVTEPSYGITALGATEAASSKLVTRLRQLNRESTVFHGNGFGGAAFTRFAERGAFHTIIDLTPHELTRIHLAGAHVPMPNRFSVAPELPRIVLPGGLNFIGLGEKSLIPEKYKTRAHYEHSGFFTHVKLEPEEMRLVATRLAESLNAVTGPSGLIVPMGGFSHQDIAGGAIEDPDLRELFLQTIRTELTPKTELKIMDAHIGDPIVTEAIIAMLDDFPKR